MEGAEAAIKVRADLSEGVRLGVTGTPAFFIGIVRADGSIELVRRIRGAMNFELFRDETERVRVEKGVRARGDIKQKPVGSAGKS
jgi:hypothetical protein